MRLLAEIERHPGAKRNGRTIVREAVRAVVLDGSKILMLYSTKHGDYHFPGGGVDEGESHTEALARELMEECGAQLTEVIGPFGKTVEYGIPVETDFDVFRMTSYYYFCEIDGKLGEQTLVGYEIDLGLQPKWVEISEALKANEEVLVEEPPLWTKLETIVLRLLEERLSSKVGKGHDQV